MAVVISVISLVVSLVSLLWQRARDRKQFTLEALNRLQSEVFDKLNNYSVEAIKDYCTDRQSVEYKELSGYLARINHFVIGIKNNIYNRKMFYSLSHGYFDAPHFTNRIIPIIESKNRSNKSPTWYYYEILDLVKWMDKTTKHNEKCVLNLFKKHRLERENEKTC